MLYKLDSAKKAKKEIYDKCDLQIEKFSPQREGLDYYAHTFYLKEKKVLFRIAKKTPVKPGWFVSIWKRGVDNIIAPYTDLDSIDFIVVIILNGDNIGEFIFPKKP